MFADFVEFSVGKMDLIMVFLLVLKWFSNLAKLENLKTCFFFFQKSDKSYITRYNFFLIIYLSLLSVLWFFVIILISQFAKLLDPHLKAGKVLWNNSHCQYVSMPSNSFSQKTAHRIFLKFYMKLEGLQGQKWTKLNFSEILILGKEPKIPSKIGFLVFAKM